MVEPGAAATPIQPDDDRESTPILEPGDVADAIVERLVSPDRVLVNDGQLVHSHR